MKNNARFAAALVALIVLIALGMQSIVSYKLTGSMGGAVWSLLSFFTVLTNLLLLVSYARMSLTGRMLSAFWLAALTIWILIVGTVYHTLLAKLWAPVGLEWWANQGMHSASPAATFLWWISFAPKRPMPWRNAALFLIWPLLYFSYALIRGSFTGTYPYPFIDLNVLTMGQLAVNAIGFIIAFWIGGLAIIAIARAFTKRFNA